MGRPSCKEMTKRQRAIAEEETPIFSEDELRVKERIKELELWLVLRKGKNDRKS